MVQHDSGNGLFAYPRGRPGGDGLPPEQLPCLADVNSKLLKLRMDFGIGDSNKMMVSISLATKDMVRYMSMYPEVWFMDCLGLTDIIDSFLPSFLSSIVGFTVISPCFLPSVALSSPLIAFIFIARVTACVFGNKCFVVA